MRNRTLPHSPGSVRARDAQSHERNSLCENSGLAPLAHARGSACLSFDSAPNGTATVGERSKSVFTQTGKQVVRHPVFAPNVTRAALAWLVIFAGVGFAADRSIALDIRNLDLRGVKAEVVSYRGRTALKLVEASQSDEPALAVLKNVALRDGTIQIEVSGVPSASAAPDARGFVGVGFRVAPGAKQFEYIYLRPTNGRAEDQVRRNHSVQYASHPDFPWQRLRKEEPEKYESYVDLEAGAWTRMRIVISGRSAKLYVHRATQPMLVVTDLKLEPVEGAIALWIGPGTEAHFSKMVVSGK